MREGKWLGGMPDGFSIPPRGLGWAWGSCEDFGAGCGLGSCALLWVFAREPFLGISSHTNPHPRSPVCPSPLAALFSLTDHTEILAGVATPQKYFCFFPLCRVGDESSGEVEAPFTPWGCG